MDKKWILSLVITTIALFTACNAVTEQIQPAPTSTSSGANHVIKISGAQAWDNLVQEGTATISTKYTASFRLKGAGEVTLRVFEGSWGTSLLAQAFQASSDWKTYSVPVQMGSNPKFTFNLTTSTPGSTPAWIDDAKLTNV